MELAINLILISTQTTDRSDISKLTISHVTEKEQPIPRTLRIVADIVRSVGTRGYERKSGSPFFLVPLQMSGEGRKSGTE